MDVYVISMTSVLSVTGDKQAIVITKHMSPIPLVYSLDMSRMRWEYGNRGTRLQFNVWLYL